MGNKIDLFNDEKTIASLAEKGHSAVTKEEADALCQELGGVKSYQVSALTQEGLKDFFEGAFRVALEFHLNGNPNQKRQPLKKSKCALM